MEYHFIVVPELDTDSQSEINAAITVIGHIYRACKATWPLSITQGESCRRIKSISVRKWHSNHRVWLVIGIPPITVNLTIDVRMEFDTGGTVFLVSEDEFKQLWSDLELQPSGDIIYGNIKTKITQEILIKNSYFFFPFRLIFRRSSGFCSDINLHT